MKGVQKPVTRLNFKPFPRDLEYFKRIGVRLTEIQGLDTHAKNREIFHHVIDIVQQAEGAHAHHNGGSDSPAKKRR